MPDQIRQVDYYYVEVPDKPGAALQILLSLKEVGVNLLGCCGFPIGEGKAQIDFVTEYPEDFVKATGKLDLRLSERKRAFLIQGGDRAGAVADTFAKLASRGHTRSERVSSAFDR